MAIGLLTLVVSAPAAAEGALAPYVAEYDVRYGRMAVGSSRTELAKAGDHWIMESTSTASGLARMIAPAMLKKKPR